MKKVTFLFAVTFLNLGLIAQDIHYKEYGHFSSSYTYGRKGDSDGDTGLVSTGSVITDHCLGKNRAFIMEVGDSNEVQWTKLIGNPAYHYDGYAIKRDSNFGGYVIVGTTSEKQIYQGVSSGKNGEYLNQYTNAFVAYYHPLFPGLSWIKIIGNANLNDGAMDVVIDHQNNIWVTGFANAKKSYYPNYKNNPTFCANVGDEYSEVLFLKLDMQGNILQNISQGMPGKYLVGHSIAISGLNDVAICGEATNQTNYFMQKNDFFVLSYNSTNSLLFSNLYTQSQTNSYIAYSLKYFDATTIVVVGEMKNSARTDAERGFIYFVNKASGAILSANNGYENIVNSNGTLRFKDVLVENQTSNIIVAGEVDNWKDPGTQWGFHISRLNINSSYSPNFIYGTVGISELTNTSNVASYKHYDSTNNPNKYCLFGNRNASRYDWDNNYALIYYAGCDSSNLRTDCSYGVIIYFDPINDVPTTINLGSSNLSDLGLSSFDTITFNLLYTCGYWIFENEENMISDVKELKESELQVIPNPNNGEFTLEFPDSSLLQLTNTKIQLIDINGKIIFESNANIEGRKININVNVPSGLYIVRCFDEKNTVIQKISIQN